MLIYLLLCLVNSILDNTESAIDIDRGNVYNNFLMSFED